MEFNKSIIKSLLVIFSVILSFGCQAKFYEGIKDPAPGVFDVCILLDRVADVVQTYKEKAPAAVLIFFMRVLEQKEAIMASGLLVDLLISIAENKEVEIPSSRKKIRIFREEDQKKAKDALKDISENYFIYKVKSAKLSELKDRFRKLKERSSNLHFFDLQKKIAKEMLKEKEFVVLIPKEKYKDVIGSVTDTSKVDLEKLGLNKKVLSFIPGAAFKREFKGIEPTAIKMLNKNDVNVGALVKELNKDKYQIKVDVLNSIFSDSKEAKKVEKRVFLNGHGGFGSSIAQLNFKDYLRFLKRLEEVNCVFLYVLSCYVGGINQVEAQKKLKEDHTISFEKEQPAFIIVAGSLADTLAKTIDAPVGVAEEKKLKLSDFFKDLHEFLYMKKREGLEVGKGKKVKDWIRARQWISKDPFKKIVKNIAVGFVENTPSIYIPYAFNKHGFFDVLEIDKKVKVITLPVLMLDELKALFPLFSINAEIVEIRARIKKIKKRSGISSVRLRQDLARAITKKTKLEKEHRPKRKYDPTMIKAMLKKAKITVGSKVQYILVYPSIINISIEAQFPGEVTVISIVPGNSQHYIKKLESKNGSFMYGAKDQKSKKVFFIGEEIDEDGTRLSMMEFRDGETKKAVHKTAMNQWYSDNQHITKEEAERIMDEIIEATSPAKDVITRGVVTKEQFKKIIDFYIKGKRREKVALSLKDATTDDIKKAEKAEVILKSTIDEAAQKIEKLKSSELKIDESINDLESVIEKLGESILFINLKAAKGSKFFKEYNVPHLVGFIKDSIRYVKENINILYILQKEDVSPQDFKSFVKSFENEDNLFKYLHKRVLKRDKESKSFSLMAVIEKKLLQKLKDNMTKILKKNNVKIVKAKKSEILENIGKIIEQQKAFYNDASKISGDFFEKMKASCRRILGKSDVRRYTKFGFLFNLSPETRKLFEKFLVNSANQYIKILSFTFDLLIEYNHPTFNHNVVSGTNIGFYERLKEGYERVRSRLKEEDEELYNLIESAIKEMTKNVELVVGKICGQNQLERVKQALFLGAD